MNTNERRLHQALTATVQENLTPEMELLADVWGLTAEKTEPESTALTEPFRSRMAEAGLSAYRNEYYGGLFLGTGRADGMALAEISEEHPLQTLEWYKDHWDSQTTAQNWKWLGAEGTPAELQAAADDLYNRLMQLRDAMSGNRFGSTLEWEDRAGYLPSSPQLASLHLKPATEDALPLTDVYMIENHGFRLLQDEPTGNLYVERDIDGLPAEPFPLDPVVPVAGLMQALDSMRIYRKPFYWRRETALPGTYLLSGAIKRRSDLHRLTEAMRATVEFAPVI